MNNAGVKQLFVHNSKQKTISLTDLKREFEIDLLKRQIAATDYKVTKCYEYSLCGLELPYDIEALHAERQSLRDKINELEGG